MGTISDLISTLFEVRKENRLQENKPDISRTKKDRSFVDDAVDNYLDEHADDGSRLPLDGEYYTTSKEEMEAIASWQRENRYEYKKAEYDCENFALSFMSNVQRKFGVTTVGLVLDWSGTHAYIMFVYDDGSIELFEPQNDSIMEPGETEKFPFERVRVII